MCVPNMYDTHRETRPSKRPVEDASTSSSPPPLGSRDDAKVGLQISKSEKSFWFAPLQQTHFSAYIRTLLLLLL